MAYIIHGTTTTTSDTTRDQLIVRDLLFAGGLVCVALAAGTATAAAAVVGASAAVATVDGAAAVTAAAGTAGFVFATTTTVRLLAIPVLSNVIVEGEARSTLTKQRRLTRCVS